MKDISDMSLMPLPDTTINTNAYILMFISRSSSTMERLQSVHHVIVILSGKGGVGKSTVAVQLALALRAQGRKVIFFSFFFLTDNRVLVESL